MALFFCRVRLPYAHLGVRSIGYVGDEFLQWLFRDCDGRVCVGTIDPSQWWDEPLAGLRVPAGLTRPRADGKYRGVYYRCTTLSTPLIDQFVRGKRDNFAELPGLWADIDIAGDNHKSASLPPTLGDAVTVYRNAGYPQPSALVATGGGLHAWWRLDTPLADRDAATELSKRWGHGLVVSGARLGWHVDYVGNTDRVLRLPGSTNQKCGSKVTARMTERVYAAEQLAEAANQWYEPPKAVEGRTGDGTFANVPMTWDEILTPHGWVVHHTEEAKTYWTRPGKDVSTGHSAVTDDRMYIFSSAVTELPIDEEMTKGYVWGLLNGYGGATRECLKAIERRRERGSR